MSKIKSMRIDDISYDIGADYSNIDNTPTFKTINNQTITGTGNISIEGGSGGTAPIVSNEILEFLSGSSARVEGEELIF